MILLFIQHHKNSFPEVVVVPSGERKILALPVENYAQYILPLYFYLLVLID